jgi:hypothetical protein
MWLVDWRDESVEVCTGKGKSVVTRDTIRRRIADAEVVINLRDVFAGTGRSLGTVGSTRPDADSA